MKDINARARLMKPLPASSPCAYHSLTEGDFLPVGKSPHFSFFSAQAAEVTNGVGPFPSFAILPRFGEVETGLVSVTLISSMCYSTK